MSKKQAVIDAPTGNLSLEDLTSALTLSPAVERRVNALMNLHDKYIEVNKKYQEEVRALERKYAEQYKPLFDKRETIISGKYEPTDEEAKYGDEEEQKKEEKTDKKGEEEKGIPSFWFQALQNNNTVAEFIKESDEEAMEFLTDIRASTFENGEAHGYELSFHFAENPFFSNTVLTKKYFLELDPMFGEYNLDHSEGCKIDWKAGKNLTVKTIKKKVAGKKGKGGAKGGPRTTTEEVPQESFFNFFTPPQPEEADEEAEEEDEDDENAQAVGMDFDIGNIIRDTIVPFAVLWFTGDAAEFDDGDFGDYDFDGEEDEEDDEEDDEEEEEEEQPKRGGRGAGGKGGKGGQGHQFQAPKTGSNIPQPQQPECKQQ